MPIVQNLKSTVRTAAAIFLALCALALVIGLCAAGYNHWEKVQAREYEVLKEWHADMKAHLGFSVDAKTKLVDGRFLIKVSTDAYPPYLTYVASSPQAQQAAIILNFVDKDGFKIYSKTISLGSFSTTVSDKGKPIGMRFEGDEYMDTKTYAALRDVKVEWTAGLVGLDKEQSAAPVEKLLDHCAPDISRSERMKRLAQHGEIRQTGDGTFDAGSHRLSFLPYDNSLLNCR